MYEDIASFLSMFFFEARHSELDDRSHTNKRNYKEKHYFDINYVFFLQRRTELYGVTDSNKKIGS
jgi:hypothetical protein